MQLDRAINSFHLLGEEIGNFLYGKTANREKWEKALLLTEQENPWFTKENIISALNGITPWLEKDKLNAWLAQYPQPDNKKVLTVGVVMAGNIPLVGFHDFLCVLLSGNILHAKLSHSDKTLLPFLAKILIGIEPEWENQIHFADKLSSTGLNAIIATGSNNTARHFEYYFRDIPHIIRKNRNGVAILAGLEITHDLSMLGEDIFSYYGLGCRNVSKLFVPKGYDFKLFFESIEKYKDVINHNKYHSNYVYNRTIYLMDGKKITDNGFLAVINSPHVASPIAVLNFEEYDNLEVLVKELNSIKEEIQCVATSNSVNKNLGNLAPLKVELGETQSPLLTDYADGVDIMRFLSEQ